MLKQLIVENFQSHDETEMALSPGVNAVIGLSDSGKSALFRAIRWACTNKPSGDAFRRKNSKGMVAVDLEFNDVTVSRERDGAQNVYALTRGKSVQEFKAFGTGDPPDEVLAAIDLDEINIQDQLEAPFLLSSSPGEVARVLNRVAHLDAIDRSMKFLAGRQRETRADLGRYQQDVKDLEQELERFADLDEADAALTVVENLQTALQANRSRLRGLETVMEQWNKYGRELDELREFLKIEDDAEPVFVLLESLGTARNNLKTLTTAISDCKYFRDQLADADQTLKVLNERYQKLMPDVCPLCGRS